MKLKAHPAAELFPMMPKDQLEELAADIAKNGQIQPIIITSDNLVLDGRNRLAACEIAGVEPEILMWDREDDSITPTEWVMSMNQRRRHMNDSQRAMVAARAIPMIEKERRKRARPPIGGRTTAAIAAETMNAAPRSVERARRVLEAAPKEAIEAIDAGKKSLGRVEKELKRAEQVKQVQAYVPPAGEFPVIVIDPPWPYEDALDGSDAARGGTPYPTMTMQQITDLCLPLAQDAAVFLWVTNSHLIDPEAYAKVAEVWRHLYGLVPKQIRTWVKPRMGLGRYWRNDTEHLVLFVRGRPVFAPVTQTTSLNAPLAGHSTKPQQAYDDIVAMCPASPRLEMFARAERPGWVTTGAELPKKKTRKLSVVDVEPEEAA